MMNWKNELGVIRPELGARVKAFFTERVGGVSSGPWGGIDGIMGLNVGSRVGDNSGCVRMNRSIVADLCPAEPRWMTQVHGIAVVNAEEVTDESVQADAQVTTQPGTVCVVQVADCLPVLLADAEGRVVGAVHAGWKSLAGGVIEAAVEAVQGRVPVYAGSGRASILTTLKSALKWPRCSAPSTPMLPAASRPKTRNFVWIWLHTPRLP